MKIKVEPEGRKDLWLADKESLVAFLQNGDFEQIHNFIPNCGLMLGADWALDSVVAKINEADMVAVLTGANYHDNMKHALSVIHENKLYMFDIGEIKAEHLLAP